MTEKFEKDIQRGNIGENEVINHLSSFKNVEKIYDVSKIKIFQEDDIDIILRLNDGINRFGEIKTDYIAHKTNNFPYEVESHSEFRTIGCIEKTNADVIYFYVIETGQLYHIITSQLKEFVNKNKDILKKTKMGDNGWGYLIPLSLIEKEEWCAKTKVKRNDVKI